MEFISFSSVNFMLVYPDWILSSTGASFQPNCETWVAKSLLVWYQTKINKATSLDAGHFRKHGVSTWSWSSSWRHINVTSKVDSQLFWLFRLNPRLVKYETSATWPFVKVFLCDLKHSTCCFFAPCRQSCSRVDPFQQIGRCRLLRPAETDGTAAAGLDRFLHWIEILPSGVLEKFFHPETSQGKFHSSPQEKLARPPGPFF